MIYYVDILFSVIRQNSECIFDAYASLGDVCKNAASKLPYFHNFCFLSDSLRYIIHMHHAIQLGSICFPGPLCRWPESR